MQIREKRWNGKVRGVGMQKTRPGKIAELKVFYKFDVKLDKAQWDIFQM